MIEDLFRARLGVGAFSPIAYFAHVCAILSLAPLDEWKSLVPKLADNQGDFPGIMPKNAVMQRLASQEMAILIFAAEMISKARDGVDPVEAMQAFADLQAEHKKEAR